MPKRRSSIPFVFVLIVALVLLTFPVGKAQAQAPSWTFVSVAAFGCASFATTFNVAYTGVVAGMYQDTIVSQGAAIYMDEIFQENTPPFDTTWALYDSNDRGLQTNLFPLPAGTPVLVTLTLRDSAQNPLWITVLSYVCDTGAVTVISSGPPAAAQAFSGPPLPGPEGRNLVLFLSDAAVLDSPGGAPTGEVIKACQTAFVLETSSDGLYGRIYVMGGWIPLAATTDVAEDYGQPGGAPIYEPCVGK